MTVKSIFPNSIEIKYPNDKPDLASQRAKLQRLALNGCKVFRVEYFRNLTMSPAFSPISAGWKQK